MVPYPRLEVETAPSLTSQQSNNQQKSSQAFNGPISLVSSPMKKHIDAAVERGQFCSNQNPCYHILQSAKGFTIIMRGLKSAHAGFLTDCTRKGLTEACGWSLVSPGLCPVFFHVNTDRRRIFRSLG